MGYRCVSKGLGIVFNQMNKEEYSILLSDNRWSKKRNKILARDLFKCKECGSCENLEVHHLYYVVDHKPWEYPHNALVTWCNECHKDWHVNHELIVLNKPFVKGKSKSYKPPIKRSHRFNNTKLRRQVNLYDIPKKDFRIIWKEIRQLTTEGKKKYFEEKIIPNYIRKKK